MTTSLGEYVEGWHPEVLTEDELLDSDRALRLADILDAPPPAGELPLTWQWVYFGDWPRRADLNADGHPVDGHFQPPIPGRRRMWAGGELEVHAPLRLDQPVQRVGTLLSATPKSGRTGDMVLASVQYDYLQGGALCHREVQNHVYRAGSEATPARTWPPRPTAPPESDAPWRHDIATDSIQLFRYSALTANSHRIHYDFPYVTEVEGYRDLVVHGPLLAQQLALLAARNDPDLTIARLTYRLQQPVFVGDAVSAVGRLDGETAELQVISGAGLVHVSASATYRRRE